MKTWLLCKVLKKHDWMYTGYKFSIITDTMFRCKRCGKRTNDMHKLTDYQLLDAQQDLLKEEMRMKGII